MKGKKLFKFQKLAKKNGPSFQTSNARITFNYFWLVFTKALILQHFNLKYHIWIKTNALSYAIGSMLSQLAFKTRLDKVVIKNNLNQ